MEHQRKPAPRQALRVALFSGNYNYVMDGPVRALNMLVGHLEHRGHDALVFAPTVKEPAFPPTGELFSIPSLALPGSRSEYRLGLGLWGKAKKRLDAFAPNLIHIAAPDFTGFQALKYAEKNRLPAVASFHTRFDTYPRYYGAAWLEKYVTGYMRNFYSRCRHVYTPSQSMTEELQADNIGSDIRIWTRGVDQSTFNPDRRDQKWRSSLGFKPDDVVIAFVGRVVLEKGIDLFCNAVGLAQAKNPNIKALVVGDGPERGRFERLLPDAQFIGFKQGEDLARAYASADVFFNPSITETFGNVTLEAMASGTPCICAAASGSKTLVAHEVQGLLSDPSDEAEGFADCIVRMAANSEERLQFGDNALVRSNDFSWGTTLDALLDNYAEVLNEKN